MKNWVGVNNDLCEMFSVDSQIEFNISMLRSSLCDYRDAYILVKETMTVPNTEVEDANQNNRNKTVIFKNCAPLTDCISEISNTEVDHAKGVDVVMAMCDFIECSGNYLETSGSS